jgi:hypothetical protein
MTTYQPQDVLAGGLHASILDSCGHIVKVFGL